MSPAFPVRLRKGRDLTVHGTGQSRSRDPNRREDGYVITGQLCEEMVRNTAAELKGRGRPLRPEIEAAMLAVPRHLYATGCCEEEAYARERALITGRPGGQEAVSSLPPPALVAEMLGQAVDALGSLEGCRVLEIGSGSGYQASLLRRLAGSSGSVTTIDLDPAAARRTAACLGAAGVTGVTALCGDGSVQVEPGRWDLIIVTSAAWDVPGAWWDLADGGVLVAPLSTWGMTRSWALRRHGDHLEGNSRNPAGFAPFRGAVSHLPRHAPIADGADIFLDEDEQADWSPAAEALKQPREEAWSGHALPACTALADLDLYLATRAKREMGEFGIMTVRDRAGSDVIAPPRRHGTPAFLHDGTFSYRSRRRWTGSGPGRRFDIGIYSHGPRAAGEASHFARHAQDWIDAGMPAPVLRVFPPGTASRDLPRGNVLDKRHSRLVVSF